MSKFNPGHDRSGLYRPSAQLSDMVAPKLRNSAPYRQFPRLLSWLGLRSWLMTNFLTKPLKFVSIFPREGSVAHENSLKISRRNT